MDTIELTLYKKDANNTSFMSEIPKYLDALYNNGNTITSYGIECILGKLGNFKVKITNDSINIKDASLQKWYMGNNLLPFYRKDIKLAFEKLGDTLQIPIEKAIIKKFHFGKNISLDYDSILYLKYLGNLNKYKRLEQSNGLNYQNAYRELCIYDKIREVKSNREIIPPLYKKSNILRLENKYNRQNTKYFNIPIITPSILYNEEFYIKLCNDLHTNYKNIDKLKDIKINMKNIATKEQLKELGVVCLIEKFGGKIDVLNEINENQKKRELTRKQANDLKKLINKCSEQKIHNIDNELVLELNKKVKESIMYYR